MRQRNDSGTTLHVSAWPTEEHPEWWPFDLAPDEEKDWPTPLAGCVEVADEKPTRKTAPATPAQTEGAEA